MAPGSLHVFDLVARFPGRTIVAALLFLAAWVVETIEVGDRKRTDSEPSKGNEMQTADTAHACDLSPPPVRRG